MLILCLIVAALAVARLSTLLTQDRLTLPIRQWVLRHVDEESNWAYLTTCDWCVSLWLAIPIMGWAALWPGRWTLAILSIPAASLVAGLLSKLRV